MKRVYHITKIWSNYKNNSTINTVAQQVMATLNRSKPNQATNTPKIKARAPETGLWVAYRMAGKVMTASVT